MRTRLKAILGLALFASLALAPAASRAADLAGKWKLVVLAYGDDEFLILDLKPDGEVLGGAVVSSQERLLGKPEVTGIALKDGILDVAMKTDAGTVTFRGTPKEDAKAPITGTFRFRDANYPARLERTDAEKVADLGAGPILGKLRPILGTADPKEKYEKLHALIVENADAGGIDRVYSEMLAAAVAAERSPEEVQADVARWLAAAEPYGPDWLAETRIKAIRALEGKKPYAARALELAREADKALGESASAETQAAVVNLLASTSALAGDELGAQSARERVSKLEGLLDEEYRKKVPPFKPESFTGREEAGNDRVVLLELFTGAQCPPCVAADVAFDALIDTYKPTEFIGLQYHLHIPGPDPLTSPASVARQDYYSTNSTPSTYFNGEAASSGGGGMAASEAKYAAYRKLIEDQLGAKKTATIDLKASRDGDSIKIEVEASAEKVEGDAKPRLRLVLVEETIRYVGGNKLRFHHHVVRDMPGGAEGFELKDGKAGQSLTVSLPEVREKLQQYLSDYTKTRPFPNSLPTIDLKNLSVVAFVQDDADKSVWHAVTAPLGEHE